MSACSTRLRLEQHLQYREILSPHRSLDIQRVEISPALKRAAEAYLEAGPNLFMASGTLPDVVAQLGEDIPEHAKYLVADIVDLAEVFISVSGHRKLRIHLEKITTDSCRRFHVDCVDLGLLRTYVGPGVQWTRDEGHTVEEAPTGAVVLLKGKHFPGWEDAEKILHRSPPLSERPASERVRLLLTIDEANACGGTPLGGAA